MRQVLEKPEATARPAHLRNQKNDRVEKGNRPADTAFARSSGVRMQSRQTLRHFRFFLLEKIVLPIAIVPLRLLMRTWRLRPPERALVEQLGKTPRLVIATSHGMLLHLLAFSWLASGQSRRLVVMLSPSLDGRLLAALLTHFGVDHVRAATNRLGVAGSRQFARRVEEGDIGVIAVDGPRGPCFSATPGFLRIATAARAKIVLAVTSASHGITLGSWDRAHLPEPFARVYLSLQALPDADGDRASDLPAIRDLMLDTARKLRSPVLPPELSSPEFSSRNDRDEGKADR